MRTREEELLSAPNVTPLVDISLTLVIIFMITCPLIMQAGIKVLESKTGIQEGRHGIEENVRVDLKRNNEILINGEKVEWKDLDEALRRWINRSKDRMVVLSADNENKVGQVVRILDIAKQSGSLKLAILKKTRRVKES
jgi:biopolymer transport protein ExbD